MQGKNPVHAMLGVFVWLAAASVTCGDEVSFSHDVLPVLSDRCFHCHGPDEENREADLRLDLESAAKADRDGIPAIVPGKPEDSELWRRITSDDEDQLMPPGDSHRKPLSAKEREAIRQWILRGAKWGKHWSFESLTRPDVPVGQANPIDAFVTDRLHAEGLTLSESARPETLLRRLSFDLTGMAPSLETLQRSSENSGNDAWQAEIDRLLESPDYAERLAMWWLDAARYSDSDGFQQDQTRQNWPWRDWVIEQFRVNKPFDEFTIEQFAGDLLPNATDEQKLATCFHRNHMTNGEGGRDPEESRIDYVIDRVNTTGTVWLGLTLGCTQCHTHKFDPISHHDYYSMFAFFNSIDEDGKAGMRAKPYLKFQSPLVDERVQEMQAFANKCKVQEVAERQAAEHRFENWLASFLSDPPKDYRIWRTPPPSVSSSDGTDFSVDADHIVQTHGKAPTQDDYRVVLQVPDEMPRVTGWRLEVFPHESHEGGRFTRDGNGEFTLTNVRVLARREGSPSETQLELSGATADIERDTKHKSEWDARYGRIKDTLNDDARDGWSTIGVDAIQPHVGVFELTEPWHVQPGDRLVIVLRHRSTHGHANIGRFRISLAAERGEAVRRVDGVSPIAELASIAGSSLADAASPNEGTPLDKKLPDELRARLLDQFLLDDNAYQQASRRLQAANKQLAELKSQQSPRNVMVLAERKERRETHVLLRGVWDAKGDVVERAVITSVLKWPKDRTQTRLDLARWLVDTDNPLTARVVVNHLWQLMFGQGLVRTPGEFGLQGELPTHPKLLDWLAVELIENDWDLQHILRLIATSRTYRQSSDATPELILRDPENRLLARAPRFRLPAWMIRDNALQVSGLLNSAIGGPPVRPYQPEGVWSEITMGRFDYQPSVGPAQYRRTVYGFWRRSVAPTFLFDSAQRRVCEVGVRRTNTPLHALTLMNDTTMLEASRALADLAVGDGGNATASLDSSDASAAETMQSLAVRVLSRRLNDSELERLHAVWSRARTYYEDNPAEAVHYTTIGQQSPPSREQAPNTAAWMAVSSLLLNLDEAITRE
ncbi:PSD1 and planctomycete cytochrome C domain-containing protein [Fuerstiella marisgermanici]|uniref:Planctomycete cytochrome C n=1 Tax=Fuerstiella marisgermanici TaxID=1891926 RepID=A0A1P8WBZ1_9PLAN|nr:PSD1 and planctomycete cytochrome C domain-containing protein [Fuerstiella marisgermanici]APZ91533.1 Planctomycete cytochrome C [Fuerstiella marisgermanici]